MHMTCLSVEHIYTAHTFGIFRNIAHISMLAEKYLQISEAESQGKNITNI